MKYVLFSVLVLSLAFILYPRHPKFKVGDCIMWVDKDFDPPLVHMINGHIVIGNVVAVRSSMAGLAVDYAIESRHQDKLMRVPQSEAMECSK